ncbi:MAG TPA: CHAT domain-containing protein, partial [Ktedonobacterales bacterium]
DVGSSFLVIRFYELFFVGDEQAGLPSQPPAQALRLAQCWLHDSSHNQLLDYIQEKSKRRQISPTLLIKLLPTLRQAIRNGQGDAAPFADPYYWAGFTHSGAL